MNGQTWFQPSSLSVLISFCLAWPQESREIKEREVGWAPFDEWPGGGFRAVFGEDRVAGQRRADDCHDVWSLGQLLRQWSRKQRHSLPPRIQQGAVNRWGAQTCSVVQEVAFMMAIPPPLEQRVSLHAYSSVFLRARAFMCLCVCVVWGCAHECRWMHLCRSLCVREREGESTTFKCVSEHVCVCIPARTCV